MIVLLVVLLLALALPVHADGIIIPRPPPPDQPPFRGFPLTIKYHRVTVTIEDQVATTHVDQVFINDARFAVEGTYIFPLPEGDQGGSAGHLRIVRAEAAGPGAAGVRGPRRVPGQHFPHPPRRGAAHRAYLQ
jgi:hypothetical protein